MPIKISSSNSKRGFTLVELMVSVSIFVFMTALLVAKYGNFNQSVLLTNLAYDVALTLRTAQTYGLSVKRDNTNAFDVAYGVHFDPTSSANAEKFILFSYKKSTGLSVYVIGSDISTYTLKRGAVVSGVCAVSGSSCVPLADKTLDISFIRPAPDSIICLSSSCGFTYAKIVLKATDGGTRSVVVSSTGQISVEDQ